MRCSSFHLALGAVLALPLTSAAVAGECPLAAAQKAQAQSHVQPVAFKAEAKDIVDTAVGAGSFKTLVAAVQAAGLVETLKGAGPFTVFAPTDEAFAKLPEGTVESLLKPENKEKLVAVLTYHVVPGKVMAADVVKLTEAPTVQGSKAKVKVVDGTVMIDAAKVVKTDIETSNGVIHVIDAVILPPQG
jgi:transforming growth factor-beta-induced protein